MKNKLTCLFTVKNKTIQSPFFDFDCKCDRLKKTATILNMFIFTIALSGCEQAAVDAEMEKLCKQDGGMKIYETVVLPNEQFTQYGDVKFFQTWDQSSGGYRFVWKSEQIKVTKSTLDILTWNHASLTKNTAMVIREIDNKVLGADVVYIRIGGAILPQLGPDPTKDCPLNTNSVIFLRTVFVPKIKEAT